MITHKYKCIFIHIPKCAGTSISKGLGLFEELKRGVQDHRTIRQIEPFSLSQIAQLYQKENLYVGYRKIIDRVKRQSSVSRKQYNSYYKFTFVRNSWARVFSWYKGVMRDDILKNALGVANDCSFKEFLNKHMNQYHLRSQLFWIKNWKGEIEMDFIGHFERLEEDFAHVCNVVGIENKSLPQMLIGSGKSYTEFYDTEMKDAIARRYREEIDLFKFKFGE